jgi:sugar-specific transcriptional regulator TrmB
MTNNDKTAESAMAALGFTEIEAAIYCELLRSAASTGYRLAQAIGKAPANVYQALAGLAQRGAVMVDDGETKTYRATPPAELLGALQHAFDASRQEAQAALAALHAPAGDDRIYQLKVPAQVYERAESMIAAAREILLFDLFPEPLARLAPLLARAHGRGVAVAGLVYGETPELPFPVAAARSRVVVAGRWPGLQLTLVADASEHLVALLSPDGLAARHGVWSDSAYLACLQHSGLAAEIQLQTASPGASDPFGGLSLLSAYPPGLRALIGPRADPEQGDVP